MFHCKNRLAIDKTETIAIAPRTRSDRKQQKRSISVAMNQLWQLLLAVASEEEVRIWQTSDRDGNTWWHGCDRSTGRSIEATTESEMRVWLDRRYY